MSESSFQDDVLGELGDDRIDEIAALLSTDADGARAAVAETVGEMTGGLREQAVRDDDDGEEARQAVSEATDPPLEGVATLGGLGGMLGGGMMAGVLTKLSRPVANAVSKKTGIPAPTITRVIEVLIPVVLSVFARRAAGARTTGAGAADTHGAGRGSGGLGDLLGQILGERKR